MRFSGSMKTGCHVIFSISIGEENQTGEYFREMVNLIIGNDSIKKVTIFKADTLQRHRIKLKKQCSDELAEQEALKMSEQWNKDNEDSIEELKKNKKVIVKTWDDYRLCSEYQKKYEIVQQFYIDNREYKHDVDSLTDNFLKKLSLRPANREQREQYLKILREYLFEESANLILRGDDETEEGGYDYEIYHGERNSAMELAYKVFGANRRMIFISIVDNIKREIPIEQNNKHGSFFSSESTQKTIPYRLQLQQNIGNAVVFFKIESMEASTNYMSLITEVMGVFQKYNLDKDKTNEKKLCLQ